MPNSSHASSFRNLLLTSAIALVAASPAMAQEVVPAKPSATVAGTPSDTPSTEAAAAPSEIIVTARNRAEKLQDVPLAITSFSSQDLANANVRNLRDVAYLTPGLTITSGGSEFGVNPVIRSQTNLNGGQGDPNVAVFIDGVYIVNNTAINVGLIDIDRIEVVKGPVSALYGRNAFAGAINYVSKKPSLTRPYGSVTGFVGNDGQYSASGVISYPLVRDVLGVKLAAGYEHFDGSYYDKITKQHAGGFKKRDIQASFLLKPTDALSLSGAYYYGKDTFGISAIACNNNNCGTQASPVSLQDPSGLGFGQFCGHFDPDAHDVEVPVIRNTTGASGNDRKVNLSSLNLTYDFGFAKLISLTGYTKIDQQRYTDFIGRRNGIPFTLTPGPGVVYLPELFGSNTNTKDFSEEIRLQSRADRPIRVQVGGFYYKGRNASRTILGIDGTDLPAGQNLLAGFPRNSLTVNGALSNLVIGQTLQHDRQYSAFAGADWDIVPGLTASGEYRYTHQKKDLLVIRSTGCFGNLTAPTATCTGPDPTKPYLYPNGATPPSGTFNYANYRGSLKYQFSRATNVYASVANGTKAGGFNQRSVAAADGSLPDKQFDPETNVTYEIGMKNSFFNNRLQLNIAAFHIKTKGIQISGPSSVPTNPGLVTKNFGSVKTDGFEIELAAKVAPGVKIHTGIGYANPKFGKDAFDFGGAGACATLVTTTDPVTGVRTYTIVPRGSNPIILQCASRVIVAPPGTPLNPVASLPNPVPGGAPIIPAGKIVLPLSGLHVPREANLQLTGGVDLTGPISNGWNWNATFNARYESRQYSTNTNINWYGPRTIVNVRAGVGNETYSLSAYVNNLTNDHTPEIVSVNGRLSDFVGDADGYLPVGRQFGVIVGAKF